MPVLIAREAGVRRRRRWLFRDLDVSVEPGEAVAVVGPPGSGRTTALLALARRFRLNAGRVTADGGVALGHVPDVSAPEPAFTVAEHVRERLALLGRPRTDDIELHGLDPARRGHDLGPYEKQVLGLILAGLSGPAVIALDGVDDGLNVPEQEALWRLLTDRMATGTAVLVTARDLDPSRVHTVIRLARDLGYAAVCDNLARSDLYIADEMFLVGTAAEVSSVNSVDDRQIPCPGPKTQAIAELYGRVVRSQEDQYKDWCELAV